jgi:putative DNA primase/helicase
MMEAQNTPKNEPFVCNHCKKDGGFMNGHHNICEQDYIKNVRCKGIQRNSSHCQCKNIGHSWGAVVDYEKPVTDESFERYKAVNDELPTPTLIKLKLKHSDDEAVDEVANLLVDHYNFVTIRENDEIYYFNGKIYDSKNTISIIKEEAEGHIRECTKHDKLEIIDKIKSLTYTDIEAFDSDPEILTLENGVFNISTKELTPHTPTNLSNVLIPCSYIKGVTSITETLFEKYLASTCTINDKLDGQMYRTILEMMASCFIKHQIDEKAFICLGNGDNGKSIALEYTESLLGRDNVARIALQDISMKPFAAAHLDGKLANIFTDIEANALKETGKLKAICSGEGIYVEHKNARGFNLYPYAKLIFSCNKFPKVFDQSDGFFRRWIIIEFKRKFALGSPDRIEGLKDLLINDQDEKNLVFSYLMGISKELQIKQKFTNGLSFVTTRKVWNANADPLNDFVENYIIDSNHWKSKRETYAFYKNVMLDNGLLPLTFRQFNKAFSEYYDENHSGSVRIWENIDFKVPKQETL